MLLPLAGLLSCVPACHAAHITAQTVSYEDLPCILRPVLPPPWLQVPDQGGGRAGSSNWRGQGTFSVSSYSLPSM